MGGGQVFEFFKFSQACFLPEGSIFHFFEIKQAIFRGWDQVFIFQVRAGVFLRVGSIFQVIRQKNFVREARGTAAVSILTILGGRRDE